MKLEFLDHIPESFKATPILISGSSSIQFNETQYLSLIDNGKLVNVFEIRYECHYSPFKQIEVLKNIILVGFEEHFYMFDMTTNTNITTLKLSGYFGYMYLDHKQIYVADADGISCLSIDGDIIWANTTLGIDGVIIHNINDSEISGSGECDPPGGWIDFVIDKYTGKIKP